MAEIPAAEREELLSLLSAYCDGVAVDAEVARLDFLLFDSAFCVQARGIYLDYVSLHWDLRKQSLRAVARDAVRGLPLLTANAEWFIQQLPAPDHSTRRFSWPARLEPPVSFGQTLSEYSYALAGLAAMCLVVGLTSTFLVLRAPTEPDARLIAVAPPHWQGDRRLELGDRLPPGKPLRLDRGALEFELASSARVLIRGPAEFEVSGGNGMILRTGELTAHVSRRSSGFTVESPGLLITDLGTEFVVGTDNGGQSQVTVLDGRIEVEAPSVAGGDPQRLALIAGDSVARAALGERLMPVPAPPLDAISRDIAQVRVPLVLHGAGVGLRTGDRDPQWQIIRVPDEVKPVARPAIVSNPEIGCMPNDPSRGQWLTPSATEPNSATGLYVFEYAFDIATEIDPSTVAVRAHVAVDDVVRAARVNGQDCGLRSPVHFRDHTTEITLNRGFLTGHNRLEFELENFGVNRLALWAALEGSGCLVARRAIEKQP